MAGLSPRIRGLVRDDVARLSPYDPGFTPCEINLSANEIKKTKEKDKIEGDMTFRGTLGGKDIPEKQGKKGAYRVFDAFSAEKITEDQFAYIWVHFIDFSDERPDCLIPKTGINAEGALELTLFNDRLDIGCRVKSISKWEKQTPNL